MNSREMAAGDTMCVYVTSPPFCATYSQPLDVNGRRAGPYPNSLLQDLNLISVGVPCAQTTSGLTSTTSPDPI